MKKYMMIFWLSLAGTAHAESSSLNFSMPGLGGSYGSDSIRTEDGVDCKNSIGGATNLEFGLTGIINNAQSPFGRDNGFDSDKDVGLYARITIPLDKPKQRINCNTLYELELRKKRLEVLKLQEELNALRRLNSQQPVEEQFEN
jgi:hypothetical protein